MNEKSQYVIRHRNGKFFNDDGKFGPLSQATVYSYSDDYNVPNCEYVAVQIETKTVLKLELTNEQREEQRRREVYRENERIERQAVRALKQLAVIDKEYDVVQLAERVRDGRYDRHEVDVADVV